MMGVIAYYRHEPNLKHSWHFPFLTDLQSIDDSSAFAWRSSGMHLPARL